MCRFESCPGHKRRSRLKFKSASSYIWPDGHIYYAASPVNLPTWFHSSYIRRHSACRIYRETPPARVVKMASSYIWPDGHIYCSRLGIANGTALSHSIWRYMCLAAHTAARGLCYCKPVCAAETSRICHFVFISPNSLNANKFALLSASSYIWLLQTYF